MEKADLILFSNVIDTVSEKGIIAGGIAVSGNKILAVGTREEMKPYQGEATQVKEYTDGLITPGICEAHMHIFEGCMADSEYFLSEIVYSKSEEDCVRMLKEFADKHPEYPSYIGGGWFPTNWRDAPLPSKKSIDAVIPDKPVYLDAADFHTTWTNSKGMEVKGITKEMAAESQDIEAFPDGELRGIFKENAAFLLRPFPSPVPKEKKELLMLEMMQRMNRFGITSLADVSHVYCEEAEEAFRPLRQYLQEGILPMRVSIYMGMSLEGFDKEELKKLEEYKNTMTDDMLRMPGLKFMVDGVTSTHTAALSEPYTDRADTAGYMNYPQDSFEKVIVEANRAGLSVRVHSIGDLAVKKSLDWFEKGSLAAKESGKLSEIRNAIEHIESMAAEDIERFQELNVIASMQPIHLIQDAGEKEYRIGAERCRYEWPVRSLQEAGAVLAFGSDFPVEQYDVFRNLHAAVTRCYSDGTPVGVNVEEEKIGMEEAIRHYTYGGAYLMGMEDRVGTLEPGKYADIAVFDRNLLATAPEDIEKAEALLTVVNGEIVFEK
jgi:predicted amidohydrolase YtcJ